MNLRAALLVITGLTSVAQAQETSPAVTNAAPDNAVSLLVRQGQRWLEQGRPEYAASSAERALLADPRNANALLLAARIAASQGNTAAASQYAERLRAAGGTPEQQLAMDNELRSAKIDRSAIVEARRLAQTGRGEDAAARYRSALGPGAPPSAYALEYYQALAATPDGLVPGQRGLAELAAAPGADDRTLLAHAESLTYTPATRAEGLRRLSELASRAGIATDVQRAWKQALSFYGNDPAGLPQFEAYLRRYADDAEVKQRLAAARAAPVAEPPGPGDEQRRRGFADLETGALRSSAQRFEAALLINPSDADALGGLGIVRLRENKAAEARGLLERAIAADPARAAQWRGALDGASYGLELAEARGLLRRGDTAGAEAILRRAIRREVEDPTDAESLLGEATLRRGEPEEAERHFRIALARRPGFAPSVTGLNQALRAQGRRPELAEIPSPRRDDAGPLARKVAELRAEASSTRDPLTGIEVLQKALSIAPNDPWVRLDLARSLRRQGRDAEGRALVEELAARLSPGQAGGLDAAYAAALLADEGGRPLDAERFLAGVPPQRRTADMVKLGERIRTKAEVAGAAALLAIAPTDARQRLLSLAGRPDPTGGIAAGVIQVLGDAGDSAGAVSAARVAEAVNPTDPARLAIAGALLAAGQEAEGAGALSRIKEGSLTLSQKQDVVALRTGSAVRAADRLNEAGDQASAFERLRPVLASDGSTPEAELALARLYQGARQPADALRIAQTVLARDPRNMDARRGAVDAAIATRDRTQAEILVREGRAAAPNDSRATVLSARVARAFGDNAQAQVLLETAASQRREELGSSAPSIPAAARGPTNPFEPGTVVLLAGSTSAPTDRVSREIAQEMTLLRNESAPRVTGSTDVRVRSGTAGLDRLNEVSATAQASFQPGQLRGRMTARVMPVLLDSGRLPSTGAALLYGTNAVNGPATSNPGNARGAGLNVAYRLGDLFSVDVGTSPLGFPIANVLGGVEIAPSLSDKIRLRVRGERRSVLDSLVSYAGVKDQGTGETWGGVTQTSGRAQLEAMLGSGTAYVGGGYSVYRGQHVANNTKIEAGAGFSYPLLKDKVSELTAGLDLVYFGFDNNQRGFTLGQGGYFSPSSFVAFNVPVDYRSKLGALSYRLGISAGYAAFQEAGSPLFPSDPALQARANAAALLNPSTPTQNQEQSRSGLVGGVRVDLEYPLSDSLSLAGGLRYDKAANWDETRATIRIENRF